MPGSTACTVTCWVTDVPAGRSGAVSLTVFRATCPGVSTVTFAAALLAGPPAGLLPAVFTSATASATFPPRGTKTAP
ncbi:hypothetical protein [Kitasatospora cheerisanensis]|uniref:hypothetical protein n=1 Tax=Kitasatospora cheerisanensis TaxID=81942 RepID=UPI000561C892|nr:hypothetical protein [Kitasatospora cheerisanensis]